MEKLSVKYKGFGKWRRAEIFDGMRWLRMDKESTAIQIEADRLFAANRIILDRIDARIAVSIAGKSF